MKIIGKIALAVLLLPATTAAGEYYVYKSGGTIVLSNLPAAQAPAGQSRESLALLRTFQFPEASAEEIAATEKENLETARLNALRDLTAQTERLADEIRKWNDLAVVSLQRPVEINQVAVTVGRTLR